MANPLSDDEIYAVREAVKYFVGSEVFSRKDLVQFTNELDIAIQKTRNKRQMDMFALIKQSVLSYINNSYWRTKAIEDDSSIYDKTGRGCMYRED